MTFSTTSFGPPAVASELLKSSTPNLSIRPSAGYWTRAGPSQTRHQAHGSATCQPFTLKAFVRPNLGNTLTPNGVHSPLWELAIPVEVPGANTLTKKLLTKSSSVPRFPTSLLLRKLLKQRMRSSNPPRP